MPFKMETKESLLSYTLLEPSTGCRIWQRGKATSGHGMVSHDGSQVYTHRLMFYFEHGYFPVLPMQVLHRCNDASCIEPSHLYEGSKEQNIQDACAAGHRNTITPDGVMNPDKVRAIRKRRAEGATCDQIGKEFGISSSNASAISRRHTWRNVD